MRSSQRRGNKGGVETKRTYPSVIQAQMMMVSMMTVMMRMMVRMMRMRMVVMTVTVKMMRRRLLL